MSPRPLRASLFVGLLARAASVYPSNFALYFKASHQDVVRVPHESSMNGPLIDSWTIEAWVLASKSQTSVQSSVVNLVGFPGRHPFVGVTTDTDCAVVQLRTANGTWFSYEGMTPLDDGKWHHVAATWDGAQPSPAQRTLALYVDGKLERAGGEADASTRVPMAPEAMGHRVVRECEKGMCEEGMHVGGLYCCGGGGYTGQFFDGTIDEVRVWTRPLPLTEIAERMYVPLNAADQQKLLFYFPMDEAGMEVGNNVIESKALPWYGMLGNAAGGGRPTWTQSQSPLTCTKGSKAPVCKRLASEKAPKADKSYGDDSEDSSDDDEEEDDEDDEDEDDVFSSAAVFLLLLVAVVLSAGVASVATYTSITGNLPPLVASLTGQATKGNLFERGDGYMATPTADRTERAADWRWAQPAPDGERQLPQAAEAPASSGPTSYGGV